MPPRVEPNPSATAGGRHLARWLPALLILLILAPVAISFTEPGFPWGHDTPPHLSNLFRFDRALWQGQLPVRWAEGIQPGAGQPLFNFYQVGFYYFVELLHASGLTLSAAFKTAPVALWWIGALFAWRWLLPFGREAAVAGSLTYALSPYVIIDVFVRAAYPEFAAIVSLVGLLWVSDGFLRTGRAGYLAAIAGLAALLLISHLPACLIGAPLLLGQVLLRSRAERSWRARLPWLVAFGALGFGLASFYVMPALWELDLVSMHRLTSGGVDFRNNFVPASTWIPRVRFEWNYFGTLPTGADDLMPLQVSIVQGAAMAVALVWLVAGRRRNTPLAAASLIAWLLVIAYALFMMHGASQPVWEQVDALAVVQFPWRFFLLISIAGAGLTAALVSTMRSRSVRVASVVVIVAVQMSLYYPVLRSGTVVERVNMNIDDPQAMAHSDRPPRTFEEPGYDPAGTSPDLTVTSAWAVSGEARVTVLANSDANIALQTDAREAVALRFNIPAFPGWRLTVDEAPAAASLTSNGYMQVAVPPGTHVVRARFENTPVRLIANTVSLLSAGAVPLLIWRLRRRPVVRNSRSRLLKSQQPERRSER